MAIATDVVDATVNSENQLNEVVNKMLEKFPSRPEEITTMWHFFLDRGFKESYKTTVFLPVVPPNEGGSSLEFRRLGEAPLFFIQYPVLIIS